MKQIYLIDEGVLLEKNDPEYENYKVYDKEYGYYDEDQYYAVNKKDALERARAYVEAGNENTYVVISNAFVAEERTDEEIRDMLVSDESYRPEDVLFSFAKRNGRLIEDFILKA